MRAFVPALALAACATPHAPTAETRPSVGVPQARSVPTTTEVVMAPTAIARPLFVGDKQLLVPEPACLERPPAERRLLGYRTLPDTEVEAAFFLAGEDGACKVSTHARAELLLGQSETLEQVSSCRGWRVTACDHAVSLALPSPPFREVTSFARAPNWQDMDAQSDGIGKPRRESETVRVPGSSLALTFTRAGSVVLVSGEKKLDAFWARACLLLDGVPHLVTPDSLVRLADPPELRALPSLHTSERAPEPKLHPWERQN